MTLRTGMNAPAVVIDKYINTAYDTIKTVADNLTSLVVVGEYLSDPATAGDINAVADAINGDVAAAEAAKTGAEVAQAAAEASAVVALGVESAATTKLNEFKSIYYGAYAVAPLTDPLGNAITSGDLYFNTTLATMQVYNIATASWENVGAVTTTQETYVYTAGDVAANKVILATPEYTVGGNSLLVYLNGLLQISNYADATNYGYTETSSTFITLTAPLNQGDIVLFISGISVATSQLGVTTQTYYYTGSQVVANYLSLPEGVTYDVGNGNLNVFVNGIFQERTRSYTEPNSSQILFTGALEATDSIAIVIGDVLANTTVSVRVDSEYFTAAADETVFTLVDNTFVPASDTVQVFVNGSKQILGTSYTENVNGTTINFLSGLNAGDVIEIIVGALSSNVSATADNVSYSPAGVGAVGRTVRDKLREFISVKDFGATGDGVTNDTITIQAAIDSLASGGMLYFPAGTYLISSLVVAVDGLRFVGVSPESTTLNIAAGTAATYAVAVTNPGSVRPLSFGLENFSIIGDNNTSRTYSGIYLAGCYQPSIKNVYFKALTNCLMLHGTFYGTFENLWFEHFTTGIRGYNASYGGNTNTFIGMNFFEGNVNGTAVMIDGTYMNNNTWITPSFSAADAANAAGTIISGIGDTYISPRFETIQSTGHWMTITDNCRIINPTITSSVVTATAKYVFDVTGSSNTIDASFCEMDRLIKFESTALNCTANINNKGMTVSAIGTTQQAQVVLDLGTYNSVHFGGQDHQCSGSSWSDRPIQNLFTRSMDYGTATLSNITLAVTTASTSPSANGGAVYSLSLTSALSVGTLQQAVAAVQYDAFAMSFWCKAVGTFGGNAEHNIQATISDNPAANLKDVLITSARWTRVLLTTKMISIGGSYVYPHIQLPIGHPGIYIYGMNVLNLGNVGAGATMPSVLFGGYVPTFTVSRTDANPHEALAWSGTYLPTLTAGANVDALTAKQSQFLVVGKTCTVSGWCNVDPTLVSTATDWGISLPIPSNFSDRFECGGVASGTNVAESFAIESDATNDRAKVNGMCGATTSNHNVFYTFTYQII